LLRGGRREIAQRFGRESGALAKISYWRCPHKKNGLSLHPPGAYIFGVTKLLEKALEAVRRLSPDDQDEIARAMLALAGNEEEPESIDPAHLSDVLESLAQAKRREFASDSEVEAAFHRFDR
jgi:hypothetical protein